MIAYNDSGTVRLKFHTSASVSGQETPTIVSKHRPASYQDF